MDTILTNERRNALGSLITNWLSKQDEEGRMLDTFDYFDADNIDLLIDEAIVPAIADAVTVALAASPSDAAQAPMVPQAVLDALRFYARGHHYNIDDDHQQFNTVSGEPRNWLHSERDDDCTMIEDGSIAKAALCGSVIGFEEPTEPLEGEVLNAAPVAAQALLTDEQRSIIQRAADAAHLVLRGNKLHDTGHRNALSTSRYALLVLLAAPAAAAPSEDAYVAQRMAETLAEVYATIIGDDARQEDESLNAIERVKKAAQVLRLEVDLYRAQREKAAAQPFKFNFPTMLRKMWSGSEVQAWLDELPPLHEVPTHAQDGNNGVTSPIGGPALAERVQFTPMPTHPHERAGGEA